jgi:hypothetical protein
MVRRIHIDDTGITRFDRQTFIHEVFDYSDGDHCTFLCPFGGGKTQLALDLIAVCATPDRQATVFVMKPKDKTITKYTPILGFETIRDWPPSQVKLFKRIFGKRPPGYVLWPRDTVETSTNVFVGERVEPDPVPPPFLVERTFHRKRVVGGFPAASPHRPTRLPSSALVPRIRRRRSSPGTLLGDRRRNRSQHREIDHRPTRSVRVPLHQPRRTFHVYHRS